MTSTDYPGIIHTHILQEHRSVRSTCSFNRFVVRREGPTDLFAKILKQKESCNALLEKIFRSLKNGWHQRGYGIEVASNDGVTLTNIRFADDVILFADNEDDMRIMMYELQ